MKLSKINILISEMESPTCPGRDREKGETLVCLGGNNILKVFFFVFRFTLCIVSFIKN